uniref:Uncharacterized protein n=1 Tax=viral metagenome TaxID=1070528 RepID=A0A6M3LQM2_9ZZZZ
MLCKDCKDFIGNICQKAQDGRLSEMEGDCLFRCMTMLLRDIWGELNFQNGDREEGDQWKL